MVGGFAKTPHAAYLTAFGVCVDVLGAKPRLHSLLMDALGGFAGAAFKLLGTEQVGPGRRSHRGTADRCAAALSAHAQSLLRDACSACSSGERSLWSSSAAALWHIDSATPAAVLGY